MRLATRNVFLNRSLSAKIAGFGPRQGDEDDDSGRKVGSIVSITYGLFGLLDLKIRLTTDVTSRYGMLTPHRH
jgi:hypothetical protein